MHDLLLKDRRKERATVTVLPAAAPQKPPTAHGVAQDVALAIRDYFSCPNGQGFSPASPAHRPKEAR
jgi:hypothetical protein